MHVPLDFRLSLLDRNFVYPYFSAHKLSTVVHYMVLEFMMNKPIQMLQNNLESNLVTISSTNFFLLL